MTAPAEDPRGGELREAIARIVYDRDMFAGDLHWSRTAPAEQDRCRSIADAALALPAVVALLDAQAAVERVRELCDVAEQQPDGYHFVATHLLRVALDGSS